jgi:2,4-dienoyl-CoA reductase-like NADH-dependent reductase (Old Yellow Enzyme family)
MYPHLFSDIDIQGVRLKNRLTMAPLYLGYAGEGGTVSAMFLDHYRLMAQSGVAMVVVENATVDFSVGSGFTRTLRVDNDDHLDGLTQLATAIKEQGAMACLQINHAGRFAHAANEPVAPSAVETFGRMPKALDRAGIAYISVMGGTYESFMRPDIVEKSKEKGYMLDLSATIRSVVKVPMIAAGRLATGAFAERAIADGKADLIGLARVLWADPQWPLKVKEGREAEIIHCDPECGDACMQMAMRGKPAYCVA